MGEHILCAALYYDDGVVRCHQPRNIKAGLVICGRRHHNCFATATALGMLRLAGKNPVQGFLTSADRFVDRIEAARIAVAAGQVTAEKMGVDGDDIDDLISEDLY